MTARKPRKKITRKPINNKLNLRQVKRVRTLKGVLSAREVADQYDVHLQTIYKIWDGTNWAWVNP